jgi:hypothetical protein
MDALAKVGSAASTPEANKTLAQAYLALLDEAIAADNYDMANHVTGSAESAARNSKDMPLLAQVEARRKEARELQSEYAKVKAAKDTLAARPDDPGANLAVGRFVCFTKADWEGGLSLLLKGSDPALKAVAEKDLAKPVSPSDVLALADAWWDVAEKAGGTEKEPLQLRAAFWYARVLLHVVGLMSFVVDDRTRSCCCFPSPLGCSRLAPGGVISGRCST